RFIEGALLDFHVRLPLMQVRVGRVEVLLRGIFLVKELLRARGVHLRQFQRRLRVCHVTLSLSHRRLEEHWIDLSHGLAGLHLRIKICEELGNVPETWLPTWTLTTGLSVPVAVTSCVIGPRVTVAV